MTLETIKYIESHGLPKLIEDFKLNATYHESLPLVLLKYDQVEASKCSRLKYHEITRECRSLILELPTRKVVAKSFRRFFNLNEYPNESFDWSNFIFQEKVDGSLISLFYYEGDWRISTSGSFAQGRIDQEHDWTWESLFFHILPKEKLKYICPYDTHVFELCTIFNKVVKTHQTPHVVLLSIFNNECMWEHRTDYCDLVADRLQVARPTTYSFDSIEAALSFLDKQPGSFEGFVLKDINNNRIKVKNKKYLELHRLKGNGNLFLSKNIIPLILDQPEEKDEIFSYYPEIQDKWNMLEARINIIFESADAILALYHDYDQKKFALAIKGEKPPLTSILFECRKHKKVPSQCKKEFEILLIKYLS